MKRGLVALAMYFLALTAFSKDRLIGPGTAMFHQSNWKEQVSSSHVFVKRLTEQGPIPNTWKLIPEFTKDETGRNAVHFNLPQGTDLYGLGQTFGPLHRNNAKAMFWNTDSYAFRKYGGKMVYESMPWVLGLREDGSAFGILFDSTWYSELQCKDDCIDFKTDGPEFRVIVMDKPNPEEVLTALADLTGKMELPPLWALGYHQCRYSYYPDKRVREVAMEFRKRGIPCDSMWLDIHYMEGYRCFTFNKGGFPNPLDLSTFLHTNSFKFVTIIDAGIKVDENYFAYTNLMALGCYMRSMNGITPYIGKVWPGECVFPDFLDPKAREYWANLNANFVKDNGIDGIWNDMNEPSIFGGPEHTMPKDCVHMDGHSHAEYHNLYGMSLIHATREGLLKAYPNKRPFILTRSNYLGGQRYAAMWTGDNLVTTNHMVMSIPMSLNIGLSGQPFSGADIGGFSGGKCTPALLRDWTSFGVYYPFVRNHADSNTPSKEPWVFGDEVERTCKIAIERRYRLLPYIYTVFWESANTGLPVMRPLFMMDPKDLTLRREDRAFLLGKDLLVIPAFARNEVKPPRGWAKVWFRNEPKDLWQADLYLRPGACIPVAKPVPSTAELNWDDLTIFTNPDASGVAKGLLYMDSGDGFGYKNGDYALYELNAQGEARRVKGNRGKQSLKMPAMHQ